MTERFKLVNKSRVNNTRIRLIKTPTSTIDMDPVKGAIYDDENEVGICLSPDTVIGCVGALAESDEITIDGDGWRVEVDGVVLSEGGLGHEDLWDLLEANGIRVTELLGRYKQPIYCDGAVSTEVLDMEDGGWMLEVDGVNLGGPYDLASLDNYSRRREVRITVPPPLVCNVNSTSRFSWTYIDMNLFDGLYNALTGDLLAGWNDFNRPGGLTTPQFQLYFDPNYGTGYIDNLTNQCLLLMFKRVGDSSAGFLEYYPEGNATVESRDGIDYISLGPSEYDIPYTLFYRCYLFENGNYTPLNNLSISGDQVNNVYLGVTLPQGTYRPNGYTVAFDGQTQVLYNASEPVYFKLDNIAVNTGYVASYYVFQGRVECLDNIPIQPDRLYDADLIVATTRFNQMTSPVEVQLTAGSLERTYSSNSGVYRLTFSPRESITAGTTITINCPPEFIGADVSVPALWPQILSTVGEGGVASFELPTDYPAAPNQFVDIILIDPNPYDQRDLNYDEKYVFSTLDGLTFTQL